MAPTEQIDLYQRFFELATKEIESVGTSEGIWYALDEKEQEEYFEIVNKINTWHTKNK